MNVKRTPAPKKAAWLSHLLYADDINRKREIVSWEIRVRGYQVKGLQVISITNGMCSGAGLSAPTA